MRKPGTFRQLVRNLRQENEQERAKPEDRRLTRYSRYLMGHLPQPGDERRFMHSALRALGGDAAEKVMLRLQRFGWAERDDRGWQRTPAGQQQIEQHDAGALRGGDR